MNSTPATLQRAHRSSGSGDGPLRRPGVENFALGRVERRLSLLLLDLCNSIWPADVNRLHQDFTRTHQPYVP